MAGSLKRFALRVEQWETFATTFINYIFHSQDGQRIRGLFMGSVLRRTLVYIVLGLPIYGLFYYAGWITPAEWGRTFWFVFLLVDIAFGLALLRTIKAYRGRIELFYASQFSAEHEEEDDLPVGHREIPQRQWSAELPEMPEDIVQGRGSAVDGPAAAAMTRDVRADASGGEDMLRCAVCKRTFAGAAQSGLTRCQICGGDLGPA